MFCVCDLHDERSACLLFARTGCVQSLSHATGSLNPLLYKPNYNEMDFAVVNKLDKNDSLIYTEVN